MHVPVHPELHYFSAVTSESFQPEPDSQGVINARNEAAWSINTHLHWFEGFAQSVADEQSARRNIAALLDPTQATYGLEHGEPIGEWRFSQRLSMQRMDGTPVSKEESALLWTRVSLRSQYASVMDDEIQLVRAAAILSRDTSDRAWQEGDAYEPTRMPNSMLLGIQGTMYSPGEYEYVGPRVQHALRHEVGTQLITSKDARLTATVHVRRGATLRQQVFSVATHGTFEPPVPNRRELAPRLRILGELVRTSTIEGVPA